MNIRLSILRNVAPYILATIILRNNLNVQVLEENFLKYVRSITVF